jgi:hypothetical protein
MPIRSHPAGLAADGHEEKDQKQQVLRPKARAPEITRLAPSANHYNLTIPSGEGLNSSEKWDGACSQKWLKQGSLPDGL